MKIFLDFRAFFIKKVIFFGKKNKNNWEKVLSGRLGHIFLIFSTPEVLGSDFDRTQRDLMGYNQVYMTKKSEEKVPKT